MQRDAQKRVSPGSGGTLTEARNGTTRGVDSTPLQYGGIAGDPISVFKHAHGGKFIASGNGWRGNCLCCDDRRSALSIAERDGWLMCHCFKCGAGRNATLASVGLRLSDVGPPRTWPPSKDERRAWSRAQREAGWSAAIDVAALESRVALLAARDIHHLGGLQSSGDLERLEVAVTRLESAANVLGGAR